MGDLHLKFRVQHMALVSLHTVNTYTGTYLGIFSSMDAFDTADDDECEWLESEDEADEECDERDGLFWEYP